MTTWAAEAWTEFPEQDGLRFQSIEDAVRRKLTEEDGRADYSSILRPHSRS